MPWYARVLAAVRTAVPSLAPTQVTSLALLTSAILARRTLGLPALARAYPTPAERRATAPAQCAAAPNQDQVRSVQNGGSRA